MSNSYSFYYEIMQLSNTGGIPCVLSMSQRNWVIIKMLYRYLRRCLLSWHGSRLGFVTPGIGEVSLGPLSNTHHNKLASKMTKELLTRWCNTKRVKRLAGNEIELGMKIPKIESRASNIPTDKENCVCCHNGSTDKDLHRICRNQYGHPGLAIGYWRRSVSVMSTSFSNP